MANKDGKPWCVEPFTTLESKVWGDWGLCCRSKPLDYHARDVSPLDHFNSDTMKRIRKDMINHNVTEEIGKLCSKCIEHERNGVLSRRQGMNRIPIPNVNKDGSITDFKFRSVEIKFFGNLCNLKCRMCGPLYSSSIAAEQHKRGEWDGPIHHNTWNVMQNKDKFFADMLQVLPYSNEIKFTGGEPMMNASIKEFVQWVVDQDLAKNINMRIITNGTKIDNQFLELTKGFRRFHATVSVDGVFDVDEYQRVGTQFEIVDSNIDLFKQYGSVNLTTAVTAINVSTLHEVSAYANLKQLQLDATSVVLYPEHLQVKVLPKPFRDKLLSEYKFSKPVKEALKDIEWPVDLWNKFIDVNPKITEIVPELKQYVGNRL